MQPHYGRISCSTHGNVCAGRKSALSGTFPGRGGNHRLAISCDSLDHNFFSTPFIYCWTGGKIIWPLGENAWLGPLLLSTSVARCHLSLGGIIKQLSALRWVQLVESLVMIGSGIFLIQRFGIGGILAASLIVSAGISLLGPTALSAKNFSLPYTLLLSWTLPAAGFLCVGVLLSWIMSGFSAEFEMNSGSLFMSLLVFLLLGLSSFKICLRAEIHREVFRFLRIEYRSGKLS